MVLRRARCRCVGVWVVWRRREAVGFRDLGFERVKGEEALVGETWGVDLLAELSL